MKNYKDWTKNDYPKPDSFKVFGTFVCGGGSTMGYKLAGFEHLGGVEIDKRMAELYKVNHCPKYMYVEDIRKFNERKDLPDELYNLDILDGSPPCTTFSMSGKRESGWGKKKFFNEGQTSQILDELVYVYCDTIKKLQPKIAILENVPGIVAGRAKKYTINIVERLNKSNYDVQIFSLNSATMGVPQARQRIFFIARRKDLNFKPLKLEFNQTPINFSFVKDKKPTPKPLINSIKIRLPYLKEGERIFKLADRRFRNKPDATAFFNSIVVYDTTIPNTLTTGGEYVYYNDKRNLTNNEFRKISTFPKDYNFLDRKVKYVCGMSVPPLMIKSIATEIKRQWLNAI